MFNILYKGSDIINTKKKSKRVGTHNGRFHADEVMATAVLKILYDIEVVRTRDMDVLKEQDIVYDVGDGEFDHHNIKKQYRENGVPYAACGLIWRHFGREVIQAKYSKLSQEEIVTVFQHVDISLIQGIDAVDNGMRATVNIIPMMNISTMISGFNPPWDVDAAETDGYFHEAVKLAYNILNNTLNEQIAVMKAKSMMISAFDKRPKPEILVLDKSYPWSSLLKEVDVKREILFVIFPRDNEFLLQTVRSSGGPYRNRKSLPKSWAGKREQELGDLIGIDDAIFCHPDRFIAGAKSFDSIMLMAEAAVNEPADPVKRGFFHELRKFVLHNSPLNHG